MITDEGYRTKYLLREEDEKVKPGIEVLREKYFIRDDGRSIELTHDVLAPLIKDDREERRKEIALAIARQRARKRATQIVIGSLFFSVLVAAMIWFFTTKKARNDKSKAEKETVQLKQSIDSNNIKLDSIKKRINLLDVNKNDSNRVPALLKEIIKHDSTIKTLKQKVEELTSELTANKTSSDSMNSMNNELRQNMEGFSKIEA